PRNFSASRFASAWVKMVVILADHARLIFVPFNLPVQIGERPSFAAYFPSPEVAHLVKPSDTFLPCFKLGARGEKLRAEAGRFLVIAYWLPVLTGERDAELL